MKVRQMVLTAVAAASLAVAPAWAADDVVLVYDASGSMWGQIEGTSKVEIARKVMAELVQGWPDNLNLGLVAYGHRSEGDCQDIETLIPPGQVDRKRFIDTVNAIRPKGKTPLSGAIQHAADLLSYRDNPATVVLISDGVETCQADPCALAEQLARQGVKFTAHVVGFDLEDEAHKKLACIAENTGGLFIPAQNAAELKSALVQVQHAVDIPAVEAPQVPKKAEPQPTSTATPAITLEVPETVITGARFKVTWSENRHAQDYVTIVPAGADEGQYGTYIRVRDTREGALVAPAEPGLYEVRYVRNDGRRVAGSSTLEVIEAEVAVAAPQQATVGSAIRVSWSSSIHPQDYVTIVPAGADEGSYRDYIRVRDTLEGTLVAPADPGLYELRYILNEGDRTLASTDIEVIEAEVSLTAPEVVRVGNRARVSWSASIHPQDYVTIVPAGADEGAYGDYVRVRNTQQADLRVPEEEGLYEVRYILNKGSKTLASASLEVVAANAPLDDGAGLKAPAEAAPGEIVKISWSGNAGGADQRISLARADQPDFSWIVVHRIGEAQSMELTMPQETGRFEIRYLDISNRKVLGRAIIQVK